MVATLTDKIGTEAEEIKDKVAVMKMYDAVPRVFENEVIVRLPFCNAGTVAYVSGVDASQFRINSIYDPDYTNEFGDHQPLGRDTWAGIYNYYKVIKTNVRVDIMDLTNYNTQSTTLSTIAIPSLVGGMLDINGGVPTSVTKWLMAEKAGNSNRTQVFTRPTELTTHQGTQRVIDFEMSWNPTLFETSVIDQSFKDTWTAVGSNPDNTEWFSIIVHNPSTDARNYYVRMQMEFLVAFKQVNQTLLQSVN